MKTIPTHRTRREPHCEIVVDAEEAGHVFFRSASTFSLPKWLFDQHYVAIDREDLAAADRAEGGG